MKWTLTVFACLLAVGVTTQSYQIERISLEVLGFNETNPGEYWKTITRKSDDCSAETVLEFNIDTGDRKWSLVEFTSPVHIMGATVRSRTNETFIKNIYTFSYDGPCQIDAKVYVRPQSYLITRMSLDVLGFNETNPGEYWKKITRKCDDCSAETVLEFNIDTGDRKWSLVEFSSPVHIMGATVRGWTNETFTQEIFTAVHDGPCQIDAEVYVRPL